METIHQSRSGAGYGEKHRKKNSKWSIGGLFRRNKKKINDTDTSSSSEDADKSFLKRPRSLRKGRSRARKDFTENGTRYPLARASDIVRFEPRICSDNAECPDRNVSERLSNAQHKLSNYKDSSSKDGHEYKNRLEKSSNERLMVESSSDDLGESPELRKSAKVGSRDGSSSLRSRASRTERYRKRVSRSDKHSRIEENRPPSETLATLIVPSETRLKDKATSNNQWTADVVYCESSDYETKYTAKMKSASSSPMQSPKTRHKNPMFRTSSPSPSLNFVPTHSRFGVAVSTSDLRYAHATPWNGSVPSQCFVSTIPPKIRKSNSINSFNRPSLLSSNDTKNRAPYNDMALSQLREKKMQTPPQPPPRDPNRRVIIDHNNKASTYSNLNPVNHVERLNYGHIEFGSSDSAFRRFHHTPEYNENAAPALSTHLPNYSHSISIEKEKQIMQPMITKDNMFHDSEGSMINKYSGSPSEPTFIQEPNHYNYLTDRPRCRKPIQIAYNANRCPNDLGDLQTSSINNHYSGVQSSVSTKSGQLLSSKDSWYLNDQKDSERIYFSDDCLNDEQLDLHNLATLDRVKFRGSFAEEHKSANPLKEQSFSGCVNQSDLVNRCSKKSYISGLPDSEMVPHDDLNISCDTISDKDSLHYEQIFNQVTPLSYESNVHPNEGSLKRSPTTGTGSDSKYLVQSGFGNCDENYDSTTRKKNNRNSLEDALNELEAIYQSLKLDDDKYFENDGSSTIGNEKGMSDDSNAELQSDLNLNLEKSKSPCPEIGFSHNKISHCRRPETPNTVTDDMAYRRLIKKERPPSHEQEVISQAGSFLLVSPTLSPPPFFEIASPLQDNKEPDVTYDDVVYRNIQHTNNSLKILDPQPPFGIPLLPVTQPPNSSYLCANAKESFRPTFKPKKYPDIISDDLAVRNLRKDQHKEQQSKMSSLLNHNKPSNININHGNYMAPSSRRLSYNNNLDDDLSDVQSFGVITNSSKVSGFVPTVQYGQPVVLESNYKGNGTYVKEKLGQKISDDCETRVKWPLNSKISTTTSAYVHDSKQINRDAQTSFAGSINYDPPLTPDNFNYKTFTLAKNENLYKLNDEVQSSAIKTPGNDFEGYVSSRLHSTNGNSILQDQCDPDNIANQTYEIEKPNELIITENHNPQNQHPANEGSNDEVDESQSYRKNLSSDFYLETTKEFGNNPCITDECSGNEKFCNPSPTHFSIFENDPADENDECTVLTPVVKANVVTNEILPPSVEGNGSMKVTYFSDNNDFKDDQGQGPSRMTHWDDDSNEGTKENCVPACNERAFLIICMVWLHQLVSLDIVAVLSIVLAVAALILIIIL